MEENPSSTTLIDISRYCSSFPDGDIWSSSQSSCSRSPVQRLFSPTPTRSSDSDSPSLPLPPSAWSLTSSFANIDLDSPLPSLWPTTVSTEQQQSTSSQNHFSNCCHCHNSTEQWTEKFPSNRLRSRPRPMKEDKSAIIPSPIQRPSPSLARRITNSAPSSSFKLLDHLNANEKRKANSMIDHERDPDEDDDDDDGTLRLHVSNIPFTWSKEKLAEVFGKYGTTFDVEVVYNERGSKGFGFVTFLAKKDALEAKRRMDREIVDGRRLVVNFAKPKQKTSGSGKDQQHSLSSHKNSPVAWKTNSSSERSQRVSGNSYQSLGFSTPPTARRQHLSGFSSLSSTPTRSNTSHNYQRYYL